MSISALGSGTGTVFPDGELPRGELPGFGPGRGWSAWSRDGVSARPATMIAGKMNDLRRDRIALIPLGFVEQVCRSRRVTRLG
jgi:hypothetical protein